jgi:hypothetical protein
MPAPSPSIVLVLLAALAPLLGGCRDERPSDTAIAGLLEAAANQELGMHRMRAGPAGVPDAVRVVNLKSLGGVSDSADIYVVSVQFDLMVEAGGARTVSQRGAKARLRLGRNGSSWRILDRQ